MIDIQDNTCCCGCGACSQRCPQSCITMQEDDSGFLYPHVDVEACVGCGLCEQVCPYLNKEVKRNGAATAIAACNPDEQVRTGSSSGGVFTLLAQDVIAQGGVVFGARFDDQWNVVHDCTDSDDGLMAFRGSKYVQSVIGDSYCRVEGLLKQGRKVLFSGTPCQIAGLRLFLGKEYDDLLLVDVACHGVPSPMVWREYLPGASGGSPLTVVNFRSKTTGWKNYSVLIGDKSRLHDNDRFMGCFLKNYSLRPSCFNCRFKAGRSGADITLADFWGIQTVAPHLDDDKGTSLVIVHTEKGQHHLDKCRMNQETVDYSQALRANPSLEHSATCPNDYDAFWQLFNGGNPSQAIRKYGSLYDSGFMMRVKRMLAAMLKRLRR